MSQGLIVRCCCDPDNRLLVGADSKGAYVQTSGYDVGPRIYLSAIKAAQIIAAIEAETKGQ